MRNQFAESLYKVACADEKIAVIVADISPAGSMGKFREEFPERFINVGVAEQSMIGLCAGMALRGFKSYAYTIAPFTIYRPFEFVRDDVCYQNLPVTLVGMGSGIVYSTLGATHHTLEDVAVMSAIPNMHVLAPCDPLELAEATTFSANFGKPLYLRIGKSGEPNLTEDAIDPFEFGKVRYVERGEDVCLIGYGPALSIAKEVAGRLREDGKSVSLVSAHTLKPLDREGIISILQAHKEVFVVEEHTAIGGLGTKIKEIAWDSQAVCRLETFALKDEFIHCYGTHADMQKAHGLSPEQIYAVVSGG